MIDFITVVSVFMLLGGLMVHIIIQLLKDYWLDSDMDMDDSRFAAVSIEEEINPILFAASPITNGCKAYDTHLGEIVTYCGSDDKGGAVCVYFTDNNKLSCYHCNHKRLMKIEN